MPVFFIGDEQVHNGLVTITGPLLDHLRDSLRVQVGDTITVSDRHRRRYVIEVEHLDREQLRGQIQREEIAPVPHVPTIVIGQALLKSDRLDWVIQKATELGVGRIVPLLSQRTVIRPRPGRVASQLERWQRIALEAAQQAERWDVPVIQPPCDAAAFFDSQTSDDAKLILRERGLGESLRSVELPSGPQSMIRMAIGPEGGWSSEEVGQASAAKFLPVTLGERILRAETAALAALALIQSRLGELG